MSAPRGLLTPDEVAAYHRDGQVSAAHGLADSVVAELSDAVDALIAQNPEIAPESLAGAHIRRNDDTGVRGREELLDCARHPDILDMVAQLLGPDLIVWGSHVFAKSAHTGRAVPWHQDGQYWDFIRPLAALTAWVAVDESTVENGCLRVIPGSHHGGAREHRISANPDLALAREIPDLDEATARDVELKPGQVSFHHPMLVHGSRANASAAPRRGFTIRFMAATSHFDRSQPPALTERNRKIDFASRPIWLVRGQDRAGNDFSVGRTAEAEPTR